MTNWRPNTEDPDWQDSGRMVEVRHADGMVRSGRLIAEAFFTGEDEVPVWSIESEGEVLSFYDFAEFRFIGA